MENKTEITDRQIADLREEISRIHRQADLINQRKTKTPTGRRRLDIIIELSIKIDEVLKNL